MALTANERKAGAREFVNRAFVRAAQTATVDGVAVDAAFAAADAWVDANRASFNAALPLPFKTDTSTEAKALLLVAVVMKQAGIT